MDLSNLKPAKVQLIKIGKELEEGKVPERVELLQEVIKVQSQDLDIQKNLDLRVDRCHYREEFQSLVLKILIV